MLAFSECVVSSERNGLRFKYVFLKKGVVCGDSVAGLEIMCLIRSLLLYAKHVHKFWGQY